MNKGRQYHIVFGKIQALEIVQRTAHSFRTQPGNAHQFIG